MATHLVILNNCANATEALFVKSMENLKIIAQCEHETTTNPGLVTQVGDLRTIRLAESFLDLNERDQLMVVKACIRTHYDLFNGSVPAFGNVLFYVLCIPDANNQIRCFKFDTHGMYVSNDDSWIN